MPKDEDDKESESTEEVTEAENAFRIQKSDLSIRPVWHQKEKRVLRIFLYVSWHVSWGQRLVNYAAKQVWETNRVA